MHTKCSSHLGYLPPLTKLAAGVLDYVLEIAVIHLDNEAAQHSVCVDDVAKALAKTPAQITPAIFRLIADAYLTLAGHAIPGVRLASNTTIYPTSLALKMLPAYAEMQEALIQADLDRLGIARLPS